MHSSPWISIVGITFSGSGKGTQKPVCLSMAISKKIYSEKTTLFTCETYNTRENKQGYQYCYIFVAIMQVIYIINGDQR